MALRAVAILPILAGLAAAAQAGEFQVTIANTNPGQNFSPPVLVLHRAGLSAVRARPSRRARRSGSSPRRARPQRSRRWPTPRSQAVADRARRPSPQLAGRDDDARGAGRRRAVAGGDALADQRRLRRRARRSRCRRRSARRSRRELRAYDAGSEANTESCEHVPCEVHGRRMTEGAEGVVAEHPGLRGDADIPPARQWHAPVLGTLTITRLR